MGHPLSFLRGNKQSMAKMTIFRPNNLEQICIDENTSNQKVTQTVTISPNCTGSMGFIVLTNKWWCIP